MPNFIQGTFRIRGTLADIKRFLSECIESVGVVTPVQIQFEEYGAEYLKTVCFEFVSGRDDTYGVYIKDSKRQYICCAPKSYFYIRRVDSETDKYIMAVPYIAAWSIDKELMQTICKKYHLDVKVNGYESGMQFISEYELKYVHTKIPDEDNYKVMTESVISYDDTDWDWYSPMPYLGG